MMNNDPFGGAGGLYINYDEIRQKRQQRAKHMAAYQTEAKAAREAMGKPLTRKERRLIAQAGRKRK